MVAYTGASRLRFQTALSSEINQKLNQSGNAVALLSIRWAANDDIADVEKRYVQQMDKRWRRVPWNEIEWDQQMPK